MKIACVTGIDITDELGRYENETVLEDGTLCKRKRCSDFRECLHGLEASQSAEGADLVITGRVSDPALTIGPLVHEFSWNITDNPGSDGTGGSGRPSAGVRRTGDRWLFR